MHSSKRATLAFVSFAFAMLLCAGSAEAQARSSRFGLGGMVGDPFGLSMKLRAGDRFAIAFGVGWEAWDYGRHGDDSFQLHADFLWSIDIKSLRRSDMYFYFGVGPQLQIDEDDHPNEDYDDGHFWIGPRVPLGLGWDFKRRPLDVFVEFAPGFLIGDHDHDFDDDIDLWFEADFAAGARYWF